MRFKHADESEFRSRLMWILKKGAKNNTYKFAMARFLLDYCNTSDEPQVKYSEIARYFFKYYWLQECKSRLRQGPKGQTPEVITIIRKEFEKDAYPESFDDIMGAEEAKIEKCIEKIIPLCSKAVVYRFEPGHDDDKIFYTYFAGPKDSSGNRRTDPKGGILLNPAAMKFFKMNFVPLYKSVILEWIRFLEKRNFGTPNMVNKIEGNVMSARDQRKFLKYLRLFEDRCFYCNDGLKFDDKTHVDHVIPYDYIGNTEMWNAVLSCQECNCKKLGRLPPSEYIDKLSERNMKYKGEIDRMLAINSKEKGMKDMKEMLDIEGKEGVEWHYTNAKKHGYRILQNFPRKIRQAA